MIQQVHVGAGLTYSCLLAVLVNLYIAGHEKAQGVY